MTLQSASRLRNALLRVLRHDASITGHDEQEVLEELAAHKQLLLRLLNVGDRNANERREIESGASLGCLIPIQCSPHEHEQARLWWMASLWRSTLISPDKSSS